MGTADNPKIIYVGGNLNIQGTVSGYGIFVVKKDIEITGDLLLDTPDPNGSKLALYTSKGLSIKISNPSIEAHAQVLAMDKIELNAEDIDFHGTLTSKKDIIFMTQHVEVADF